MANDFVVVGSPVFSEGRFGNAMTPSVANYLRRDGANVFNQTPGQGFTVEYWVKHENNTQNYQIAFGRANAEWWGFNQGRISSSMPGMSPALPSTQYGDNQWHHYAWVMKGTAVKVFVDGALVYTGTTSSAAQKTQWPASGTGSVVAIGVWPTNSAGTAFNYPILGQIDEVRISNGERYTAAFTPAAQPFGIEAGTLGLYHLEADGTDSAQAETEPPVATAPSQVTGLVATPSSGQLALSWTAPAVNGSAITDYVIEYRPIGSSWVVFSDSVSVATSATLSGLTNGQAYEVRVAAVNGIGWGPFSSTLSATPESNPEPIPNQIVPTDPNLLYSPFNWHVEEGVAATNMAGAYLEATVQTSASGIIANFDMTSLQGVKQMAWRVDKGAWTVVTLAATVNLAIPSNGWRTHVIDIVFPRVSATDRWTIPNRVKFTGFTAASAIATRPRRHRSLKILCYGDSILEGYAVYTGVTIDARQGWGYPLKDLLGAEVGVVGVSAQGFSKGGEGSIPAFGSTWNQQWLGQARSFPTPPDLVLINMGTNDGVSNHQASMVSVLNGILSIGPNVKIGVIQQWNGTAQRTNWQTAIANSVDPTRVTYIDTTGWFSSLDASDSLHPWGYINLTDLSPRLASQVKTILGTGSTPTEFVPKRYVRKNGIATPVQ